VNTEQARQVVTATLRSIAPELSTEELGPDDDLQEIGGLDSMDFLNFMIGLHEATGLDVPERDYPELSTLGGAIAYLTRSAA
jgi:acyl carrier protein